MRTERNQLIAKLEELDLELDQLFRFLSGFANEQHNHKKDPNSWSALQVMNHLILSETYSLKYCIKKLSFDPDLNKVNLKSRFNSFLLSFYLKVPIKIKAPTAVGTESLPDTDTLEHIMDLWKDSRAKLKAFIQNVDEKYLDKEVYKHPFGVRISILGMLNFYRAHFRRHRKQIYRGINV